MLSQVGASTEKFANTGPSTSGCEIVVAAGSNPSVARRPEPIAWISHGATVPRNRITTAGSHRLEVPVAGRAGGDAQVGPAARPEEDEAVVLREREQADACGERERGGGQRAQQLGEQRRHPEALQQRFEGEPFADEPAERRDRGERQRREPDRCGGRRRARARPPSGSSVRSPVACSTRSTAISASVLARLAAHHLQRRGEQADGLKVGRCARTGRAARRRGRAARSRPARSSSSRGSGAGRPG